MPNFSLGNSSSAWIATAQWNDNFEVEFSQWVERLFAQRAPTLAACLQNPQANSLYSAEDKNRTIFSDCADLPYLLRAYFSYKKKLPFSFTAAISGGRYTAGNKPLNRRSFLDYSSFAKLATALTNNIHSGFFRCLWSLENTDTYLSQIKRGSIVPGVVYYDVNGHVLVVSKIETDGTVWFADGHPDNSLTWKRFGEYLSRGYCKQGGGFRRWRQQEANSNGQFSLTSNAASNYFDAQQTQCQAKYTLDGFTLNYHQWVKKMLAGQNVKIDPLEEFSQQLDALHHELIVRVEAVAAAISNGINQKPHPAKLPFNIYGADGEWEAYATPGRDARLKSQIREAFNFIKLSASAIDSGNHPYLFAGSARSLIQQYQTIWQTAAQKTISYRSSAHTSVTLNIATIMARLFKLSFDPYHCVELRWGDTQNSSCQDNADKLRWYAQEQKLRNVIDPNHQVNTTLEWGPETAADIDIAKLLTRLQQRYA